jgi:hypothetical protein
MSDPEKPNAAKLKIVCTCKGQVSMCRFAKPFSPVSTWCHYKWHEGDTDVPICHSTEARAEVEGRGTHE